MLSGIRHYTSVTLAYLKLSILTVFEYPANMIGWLISNPLQFIVGFATIQFVVKEFGDIAGWNYGQLAFLYGLAIISHALSMIFFVQGWFMGYSVIEGDFDRYLLRPMSVLYQFCFTQFNLIGITDLIPGLCVFIYGCVQVGFVFNLRNILALLTILVGATFIRGGIYIAIGSSSFWSKSIVDFGGYTQELFDKTTMYPLSMYPESVQFILTFIIPIGWVSFYPAAELMGISTDAFMPGAAPIISLGAGALVFAMASVVFYAGLKKYESAGN